MFGSRKAAQPETPASANPLTDAVREAGIGVAEGSGRVGARRGPQRAAQPVVPRERGHPVAHRVALAQFQARGIARKKDRSGILIFVSLAER